MSNKRKARPRHDLDGRRGPDVVRRIARANHEDETDVKAAIAAMVADGIEFEELWDEHLPAAINGGGVVDYAARLLEVRRRGAPSVESLRVADRLANAIQAALDGDGGPFV